MNHLSLDPEHVTDVGIAALDGMTFLMLNGKTHITSRGLIALARRSPALVYLYADGIHNPQLEDLYRDFMAADATFEQSHPQVMRYLKQLLKPYGS